MSILAAQMQLRRRWLCMMMQRGGGGRGGGTYWPLTNDQSFAYTTRGFATSTQKFRADTHQLSNQEIKEKGIEESKRPPGTGPGEYMHQRKHFSKGFLTSKEIVPVYPLIFMVSVAFILGVVTMYRELVEHPMLIISKKKRRERPLPELDEKVGVEIVEKARDYHHSSPMRRMALGESVPDWIKRIHAKFFHMPPKLPGDNTREIEPAEPYTRTGPPDYMP